MYNVNLSTGKLKMYVGTKYIIYIHVYIYIYIYKNETLPIDLFSLSFVHNEIFLCWFILPINCKIAKKFWDHNENNHKRIGLIIIGAKLRANVWWHALYVWLTYFVPGTEDALYFLVILNIKHIFITGGFRHMHF